MRFKTLQSLFDGKAASGVSSAKRPFAATLEILEDRSVPCASPLGTLDPPAEGGMVECCRESICCAAAVSLEAGPRLASIDSSQSVLLDAVVGNLLGGNVSLTVLDWNALAESDINLGDFLNVLSADLGVAGPDEAVNADVTLAQVVTAATAVAQADGNTELVEALSALQVPANELQGSIKLIDLLNVDLPDGSLANVNLNALDFVTGSAQLFNFNNVVATPQPVTVSGTDIGLGGVVHSVELYAQVVEPPVITIAKEGTSFHTAAMRLKLNVDIVDANLDTTQLEQTLEAALGVGVDVQADATLGQVELYVNVARAKGIVTQIDAIAQTVTVDATPGVADVYLGTISDALFYDRTHLIDPLTDLSYSNVGSLTIVATDALGGELANATSGISAQAFGEGEAPLAESLLFTGPYPETQTIGSSTSAITNLVTELAASLDVQLDDNLGLVLDPLVDTVILPAIDSLVTDSLQPTLESLMTGLVDPQLELLGVGIGEMDVTIDGFHSLPPVATDDAAITNEDVAVTVSVLSNDADPDGGELAIASVSDPSNGSVVINPDGTLTYTPNADFFGDDSFTYSVKDADCCTTSATVTITVSPVNDAPVAGADAIDVTEDTPFAGTLPATDVDGDPITYSILVPPEHGTLSLDPNTGEYTYTPDPDFHGADSFQFQASDGSLVDGGTISVTVSPVNDAVQPLSIAAAIRVDGSLSATVNANDIDGDEITYFVISGPSRGELSSFDARTGEFTYAPAVADGRIDRFEIGATDGRTSVAKVFVVAIPRPHLVRTEDQIDTHRLSNERTTSGATATGIMPQRLIQSTSQSFSSEYEDSVLDYVTTHISERRRLGTDAEILGMCYDGDGNGSSRSTPVPGQNVTLEKLEGQSWRTVRNLYTDENGLYHFGGLTPGVYRVRAVNPDGGDAPDVVTSTISIARGSRVVGVDFEYGRQQFIEGFHPLEESNSPNNRDRPRAALEESPKFTNQLDALFVTWEQNDLINDAFVPGFESEGPMEIYDGNDEYTSEDFFAATGVVTAAAPAIMTIAARPTSKRTYISVG